MIAALALSWLSLFLLHRVCHGWAAYAIHAPTLEHNWGLRHALEVHNAGADLAIHGDHIGETRASKADGYRARVGGPYASAFVSGCGPLHLASANLSAYMCHSGALSARMCSHCPGFPLPFALQRASGNVEAISGDVLSTPTACVCLGVRECEQASVILQHQPFQFQAT
jgi:hypothetical protein